MQNERCLATSYADTELKANDFLMLLLGKNEGCEQSHQGWSPKDSKAGKQAGHLSVRSMKRKK